MILLLAEAFRFGIFIDQGYEGVHDEYGIGTTFGIRTE
jgi:hypothetical protein